MARLAGAIAVRSTLCSTFCSTFSSSRFRLLGAVFVMGVTIFTTTTAPVTAGATYDGVVVFGTSLSDSGNAFALAGGNNTPPDYWVDAVLSPFAPYARGGHHLSNGATWIEQIARPLGLAGSVQPAFRSTSATAMNFAIAEARARDHGGLNQLATQLAAFFQRTGGFASPDSLYAVEMGSNDVNDALRALLVGGDPSAILDAASTAVATSIGALYGAGARHFVVWNVPDLGLTPAARAVDQQTSGVAALLTQFTVAFNAMLDADLAGLALLPGIDIVRVDAFATIHEVVLMPHLFGLTNVTSACITPGVPPFTCRQPDDFLFWDGLHPTQAGHAILAAETRLALGL
jgi:phospholipase/lecithinase/hemolysin